ncbi:MAG: pilus assembly protein TadG-related protein, partial [Dehalococcoidia bacterium]
MRGKGERGQTLVLLTLLLPVVLGFVALTLDVGFALVERRNLQNATDAAALAAAQDLANGESDATVTATAIDYLQRNGYNVSNDTIVVNIPPASGTFAGLSGYVEVLASSDAPVAFLPLFLDDPFTPDARSVAEGTPTTGGGEGGTLPPPAPVPTTIDCGTPDVDGRVTDSDGYTKLGDLGVGETDYGDVFVGCDSNFYYFAMRLNGPDTGGPVPNDNAYGGCKDGEVKYKDGDFEKLKGSVASVDVPGSSFTVEVLGAIWTVDVDGGTSFRDGISGIGDLILGMGVEVKGAEVGSQHVLASEVKKKNDTYCTWAEPDYHVRYDTGWQYVGQHTYGKLLGSDRARFQISCGDTTEHDFILDYLRETGTGWASDVSGDGTVYKSAPTDSASSLEWNLEHPDETGWGDDPGEDPLSQSPPFNPTWPTYDSEYDGWIWEMIYEFKVPKQPLLNCSEAVYFGLYDFSGSTGGLVGIHSSPAKTA